jgi:hypothetical protein
MSIPPIPPPLEHLGNRSFAFYPPILNIQHNEWIFRKATWSEILVVNAKTAQELWIPRRFIGEVSRVEDPVMIIGLLKELEFKAGSVWPHQRRILEMPIAVGERTASGVSRPEPAPVVGIRLEGRNESRIGRLILGVLVLGVVGCLLVVMLTREGTLRPRVIYTNKDQDYLALRYTDDSNGVFLKLGQPQEQRWREAQGEIQYQVLSYPQRGYYVLLMGTSRKEMHYIGSVDRNWDLVHSVPIPSGGDTKAIVRSLKNKRF